MHDSDLAPVANPFGDGIPFVFVSACETGAYAKQSSLAELFLAKGTGAYLGAIRYGLCESRQCEFADLVVDKWNRGNSFARALRDARQLIGPVPYTMPRYWNAIYQLFGDAKFGNLPGYLPTAANPHTHLAGTLTGEVQFSVPAYQLTHTTEGDHITIPGCLAHIVPDKPTPPACQLTLEYAPGVQVQDVTLLDRSDAELLTGLDVPITTLVIPGGANSSSPSSSASPGRWPDKDYNGLSRRARSRLR
ncbi:hypothetical protein ACFLWA_12560 [Chloroflexota bacterium]